MDLSFSPEQELLRDNVRRYCREQLQKKSAQDSALQHREHWAAFANLGWLGVLAPEEIGGTNGSIIEVAIILEEFGRNLVTEPYLPCAVVASSVVNQTTNQELRSALLAPMIRGDLIVSLAHTEPEARGDSLFVETTARKQDGCGYLLSGRKTCILGGPLADKFAVSARVAGQNGNSGRVAVFIVDKDAPGLFQRNYALIDGKDVSDLRLEDVAVNEEAVLLSEDSASCAIEMAVDCALAGLCAEGVGAMDKIIKVTAEFLKTRRAYGSTLNKYQALQHRVADMLIELELSRSMLYCAFAAFSGSNVAARRRAVSSAKALIGRSAKFVAANGVQLHGAQGMADDYVIGRHFKQLTVIEALFGDSEFHWNECGVCCVNGMASK